MLKIKSEYPDLDKYESFGVIYYYKKYTFMTHNPYVPAFISKDKVIEYWIENKLHRLDGPARIFKNGNEEYWINNEYLTKEDFQLQSLKLLNKEYLISLL